MICKWIEMREWDNECCVRWCAILCVTCDHAFVTCDYAFVTCDHAFVTCDYAFVTCDHASAMVCNNVCDM